MRGARAERLASIRRAGADALDHCGPGNLHDVTVHLNETPPSVRISRRPPPPSAGSSGESTSRCRRHLEVQGASPAGAGGAARRMARPKSRRHGAAWEGVSLAASKPDRPVESMGADRQLQGTCAGVSSRLLAAVGRPGAAFVRLLEVYECPISFCRKT